MRIFTAFPLNQSVKKTLQINQEILKNAVPQMEISWTEPSQLHITVEFAGNTNATIIDDLAKALQEFVSNFEGFSLSLGTVNCFPDFFKPSVIVQEVIPSHDKIFEFQKGMHKVFDRFMIETQGKKWLPHITLGRIRDRKIGNLSQIRGLDLQTIAWQQKNIVLFHSNLTATGPIYRPIEEFSFSNNQL